MLGMASAVALVYDSDVAPPQLAALKQELESASANYEIVSYPGAKHGFTNPKATELGQKLAGSEAVRQCITRQWFRFAMSRYEQDNIDGCSMKSIFQRS